VLLSPTLSTVFAKAKQIVPLTKSEADFTKKVSNSVQSLLDQDADALIPVLVKLSEQVDLTSYFQSSDDKIQRGLKVYQDLTRNAQTSQVSLVSRLNQEKGLKYRRFYIYNVIAIWNANKALVKELATRSDVAKIYGNPTVKMDEPIFVPMSDPRRARISVGAVGDNISYLGADKVWAAYPNAGQGIIVGGQDTGVEFDHPALKDNYRGRSTATTAAKHDTNWHDAIHADAPIASNRCGYDLRSPCDDGDHGTHTIGTAVGAEGDKNIIGVAPKAQWIACRNMDGGAGTPASYLECFEWFLAPYAYGADPMTAGDPAQAPHVINNSWGCPSSEGCTGDELVPALQAMKAAGIMTVISAGNEGPGCSTIEAPPAWHSELGFQVGAYDHRSEKIANFSSRGPSKFDKQIGPDVVAPGVSIRSAVPGKKYAQTMWSGTSMAGPHVAGAVALLWSVNPRLIGRIDETTELLRSTAIAKTGGQSCGGVSGSAVPNNTFGFGMINIQAAIEKSLK